MAAKKDTFILHTADYETIRTLSPAQKGALLDAIFCHAGGEEMPTLDPMTLMAFRFMAAQLDRDLKKWEETCRKRAEAGRKGAEARLRNAKQAIASSAEDRPANQADTDTDTESDTDSESESECEGVSDAVPPALEAVAAYCRARRNNIDAEQFCDYYTARGWQMGSVPMTDWRAAVRSWERKEPRAAPVSANAVSPPEPADTPLADWERDWLAEVQQRKKARENAAR